MLIFSALGGCPTPIKAVVIAFFMCTWKLLYYAPNTIWILQQVRARKQKARSEQGKLREVVPDDHQPVTTLRLTVTDQRRRPWSFGVARCCPTGLCVLS